MKPTIENIFEYLSKDDNLKILNSALLIGTVNAAALQIALPFKTVCGRRTSKKMAKEILAEAKKDADTFFDISPELANPEMISFGTLQASYMRFAKYGIWAVIGAGAFAAGMPWLGGIIGAVTAARLGKTLWDAYNAEFVISHGVYLPNADLIVSYRSRENRCYNTMAHEYSHAVYYKKRQMELEMRIFEEGFATGAGNAITRAKNDVSKSCLTLSAEVQRIGCAIKALQDKGYPARFRKGLETGIASFADMDCMYGLGLSLFKLGETRHGKKVYKEVLEGNDKILFE